MPSGIIIKGIGGFYYVESAGAIYECKARGIFRRRGLVPLAGDRVDFSLTDDRKKVGCIDNILPRQSLLARPTVANVNQVVVVISVKSPSPDFMLVDKLLITAGQKEINVVVCINKIDLDVDEEYKKIISSYEQTNYTFVLSSSKTDLGLGQLKEALDNRISVFAGQSGVGKSTILNRIMSSNIMKTGEISERNDRGKHTTRHTELIKLGTNGYVADTPGFSSFDISEMRYDELQLYYPEFREYLNSCKFARCSHISEPGCSIKEALGRRMINEGRYARYIELYNSLRQIKDYETKKHS